MNQKLTISKLQAALDNLGAMPETAEQHTQKLRPVGEVNTETLNEDQKAAFDALVEFVGMPTGGMFLVEGYAGTGKAQPVNCNVVTPDGLRPIGDIVVGDKVITASGKATKVTGVYPQGNKKVVRVNFSDGTSTVCCKEHLWLTSSYEQRNSARSSKFKYGKDRDRWSVKTTEQIMQTLYARDGSVLSHEIPVTKPITGFSKVDLPIDPYVLGALIGDGSMTTTSLSITSVDEQILIEISHRLTKGIFLRSRKTSEGKAPSYGIVDTKSSKVNRLSNDLLLLGLIGKKSEQKFIPDIYFLGSVGERLSLLRGLMDTDGTVSKGQSSFCTSSEKLAKDVVYLVNTLGGTARIRLKTTTHLPAYNVSICMPPELNPFLLDRKRLKVVPKTKYTPKRYISSVTEIIDELECVCISVEDASRLYLTDNCIVTHNTYLINTFVEWFLQSDNCSGDVGMSAPTNKAVKVMYSNADYYHPNLKFMTTHSALNMREKITDSGEIVFEPDWGREAKIDSCCLIVVDETSMLSDQLFDLLFDRVKRQGLKIIFLGDPAQIPPVKAENSIPFRAEEQQRMRIGKVTLTDIVRQAKGNPIIQLSMLVRDYLKRPTVPHNQEAVPENFERGVMYFDRRGEFDELADTIEAYFKSPQFAQSSDFCKVIAWTNKAVDGWNQLIRQALYGENPAKLEIGERLIVNKPIIENDSILLSVNDEVEIVDLMLENFLINDGQFSIPVYKAKVKAMRPSGGSMRNMTYTLRVVHETGETTLKSVLDILKKEALRHTRGSNEARSAWKEFYAFQENFHDLKYNYAITAHKSQGSTYENAFVMEYDIDRNQNVYERNRIKYTAYTRPKSKLFIGL